MRTTSGSHGDSKGSDLATKQVTDNNVNRGLILELINVIRYNEMGINEIVHALDGVSLKVFKGDFISIMGPSGSGKTTLLNQIAALDTPTSGQVILNNHSLQDLKDKQLTEIRRHQIGLIFQYNNLLPVLTSLENVSLPLMIAGVAKDIRDAKAKELLTQVGLADRMNYLPEELSGGQLQRVSIARALCNDPTIVLADEPTGDLDSKTAQEIMDLFEKLNREHNHTFIIVTHDENVAKRTKKTIYLKDGKIDKIEER